LANLKDETEIENENKEHKKIKGHALTVKEEFLEDIGGTCRLFQICERVRKVTG